MLNTTSDAACTENNIYAEILTMPGRPNAGVESYQNKYKYNEIIFFIDKARQLRHLHLIFPTNTYEGEVGCLKVSATY